ncbi:hypothetical protein KQI88_12125 [Alkaliphilus sp. MSJ-5]|uniref:DUF3899 domain-containing protein n=1 Tax=Alkaliphilus flagellatus TaxID=2841507 RepID=A0ABS6G454_9FIRM|nr:hypothetical protein [Alkaliphilus flagellatus]MBU5677159.1 hypothetical protein [Alkaliphilus flagellatus]
MKTIIERFKKVFSYSIGSILLTSLLAALFGFVKGNNLLPTILNANYIVSTIIIAVGIFGFFVPIRLKKSNRLVDHSNVMDVLREEKDIKLSEALVNISWGICHIILVGILEIVVKSLI